METGNDHGRAVEAAAVSESIMSIIIVAVLRPTTTRTTIAIATMTMTIENPEHEEGAGSRMDPRQGTTVVDPGGIIIIAMDIAMNITMILQMGMGATIGALAATETGVGVQGDEESMRCIHTNTSTPATYSTLLMIDL